MILKLHSTFDLLILTVLKLEYVSCRRKKGKFPNNINMTESGVCTYKFMYLKLSKAAGRRGSAYSENYSGIHDKAPSHPNVTFINA